MSEGKRYYWLKLQDGFFHSKRIKKLRRLDGGDTCIIIYLKMQFIAMKNDGYLEYTGLEPSFAEELALDLDEDPGNVDATIQFLLSCGLMETSDNREYFLPFAVENTGSEGAEAKRQRDYRMRRKQLAEPSVLQGCDNVTTLSQNRNGEIEIEKELEIDKEKEIELEIEKEKEIEIEIEELPRPDMDLSDFSPIVQEALQRYFKHRKELKKPYKPTGLATFLNSVKKNVQQYGDVKVCQCIDLTIENGWTGVFWEKLENSKPGKPEKATNNIFLEILEEERRKNRDTGGNSADPVNHQGELVFDI